jgi:hypothetical protein
MFYACNDKIVKALSEWVSCVGPCKVLWHFVLPHPLSLQVKCRRKRRRARGKGGKRVGERDI